VADGMGIIIGIVLGKKIPERFIKWFAALVFIAFGVIGLYDGLEFALFVPAVIAVVLLLFSFSLYLKRQTEPKQGR
jgi:Na+-translocating ferredoxin:NAD+ oxidoreductase RnfD subunit